MSTDRPRTSIATVCLSGPLEDKLEGAAAAGFDGVELFEPDMISSSLRPAEVRRRCQDLGLTIDLYQPFRDFDSTDPRRQAANLRRAENKFEIMAALGTGTLLVCSSVSGDAATDDDELARQLHSLADRAAGHGIRIAYEALAWGRHVNTYDHSWRIADLADHPALGVCIDSFHVLARGSGTSGIAKIPGDKIFFLQLADAPVLDMDVLQWSRHYRLFPGQGAFDLRSLLRAVLAAGYRGPLSLEVFNDIFRQSAPRPAAVDAMRSLRLLIEDQHLPCAAIPAPPPLTGFAFVEIGVDEAGHRTLAETLTALGFDHRGDHRGKPVELWQNGEARILLNRNSPGTADITALAVESADPGASVRRAEAMSAPRLPRTRGPAEADPPAVAAPDGTSLFFCHSASRRQWLSDFVHTGAPASRPAVRAVDHVALTQPFDHFDEASLFYRAVLGLEPQASGEFAAPFGLIRARAFANDARHVRIALTVSLLRRGDWAPGVVAPQSIAFATEDIAGTVAAAKSRGARILEIPDNYYDDLDARLELPAADLARFRELGILYEQTADGNAYLSAGTELLGGRVFLQLVQRLGANDSYGWTDAPVRMATHRRLRIAREAAAGRILPDGRSSRRRCRV